MSCFIALSKSKVLLVGGFGSSPYLKAKLREALRGGRNALLTPHRPAAAVLQGAVLYGLQPELIHARASRMTYGVRVAVPYEDWMPGSSKFWHPVEQQFYSSAGFQPFVYRGQLVGVNDIVTHAFQPVTPDQQMATIELWGSGERELEFIDEQSNTAHMVGELQVMLPDLGNLDSSSAQGPSCSTTDPIHDSSATVGSRGGLFGSSSGDYGRGHGYSQLQAEEDEDEIGGNEAFGGVTGLPCAARCRPIEVSLYFGRTEIKVTAHDVLAARSCSTRVKFAFS